MVPCLEGLGVDDQPVGLVVNQTILIGQPQVGDQKCPLENRTEPHCLELNIATYEWTRDGEGNVVKFHIALQALANLAGQLMNEMSKELRQIVIPILDGWEELRTESFLVIELADTPQGWAKIPVPIAKVGIGTTVKVSISLYDQEVDLIRL